MRVHTLIFVGLLIHGMAILISGEESNSAENHSSVENLSSQNAQERSDEESKINQIDLQSSEDTSASKNLPYNAGNRIGPLNSNARVGGLTPPLPGGKPFGILSHGKQPIFDHNSYNGPPPPPPLSSLPKQQQAMEKYGSSGGELWPAPIPEMPKIISLDVKCEKNSMKVYIGFDKPFFGIVFSKGHYSNVHCVHMPAGLGRTSAQFEIGIHACGTSGNTENGLYGYGAESGSGTYFENIIVIQYDPQVQEVWDQARKLRCTWHDQYEKSVTFRPFPVDMLDVVRTDFAGDNVGCWMQIQVGRGPWASEVSGLVKIGQTMTMVLAIKDDDSKFDMLVRNCMAHDGKRAPIQLVDQKGCVTRPKLMSRFTKIRNFGSSATVLSYAHFQAFKFPDSMEVHFQCTIQICRYQCPDQCSEGSALHALHTNILGIAHSPEATYGAPQSVPLPLEAYLNSDHPREERRIKRAVGTDPEKEVGVNRFIRVVSSGDLSFVPDENNTNSVPTTVIFPAKEELYNPSLICMTTTGFTATLVVLLAILLGSCIVSTVLCVKLKPFSGKKTVSSNYGNSSDKKQKSKNVFFS